MRRAKCGGAVPPPFIRGSHAIARRRTSFSCNVSEDSVQKSLDFHRFACVNVALPAASPRRRAEKRHPHADEHDPDRALGDALPYLPLEPRPDLPAAHNSGHGVAHQFFRKCKRVALLSLNMSHCNSEANAS